MFGSSKDKNKNKASTEQSKQPKQSSDAATQKKISDKSVNQSLQVSPSVLSGSHSQPAPSNQSVQVDRSNPMETLISESCKIEGNIYSDRSVKVDGKVEGNINVKETLIVSTQGEVIGDVTAESLIIYGNLKGDSQLKEIHIQGGGHIDGNIKTESLKVDPNATYNGVVTMTKESLQPAAAFDKEHRSMQD